MMHPSTRSACLVAAAWLAAAASATAAGPKIEAKSPAERGGYKLDSAVAIGGGEAPEEAQFYERTGQADVDADARGNIYVLDPGGPRVQVFDAGGRFVRSFGKSGEGPGEMKMPAMLAVAPDGKVAVFDLQLRRISVYDAAGKLLRDQLASTPIRSLEWDAQGRLVCEGKMQGAAFVEVYDAGGKTVWSDRPADEPRGGRVMMFEIGNETVSPRVAVAAGGDVFHGSDAEYGVRRLVQGQVAQTWVRPYDRRPRRPLPRPNEDGEGGAQVVVVQRRGGGAADGAQTSVTTGHDAAQTHTFSQDELEKMLPKFSPDIRGLIGWPDGRLWVITSTDEGDNMVTDEWSERGEYRKRFAIPSRYSRLRLGADGKLYAVSHDADEYPIVHRLNVTPVP